MASQDEPFAEWECGSFHLRFTGGTEKIRKNRKYAQECVYQVYVLALLQVWADRKPAGTGTTSQDLICRFSQQLWTVAAGRSLQCRMWCGSGAAIRRWIISEARSTVAEIRQIRRWELRRNSGRLFACKAAAEYWEDRAESEDIWLRRWFYQLYKCMDRGWRSFGYPEGTSSQRRSGGIFL